MPEASTNQPSAFYATRISSNLDWIQSVLALPVPPDERPTLQSAPDVAGPYADQGNATIDETARTLTVPRPDRPQFYRLRACGPLTIKSIQADGARVLIAYE